MDFLKLLPSTEELGKMIKKGDFIALCSLSFLAIGLILRILLPVLGFSTSDPAVTDITTRTSTELWVFIFISFITIYIRAGILRVAEDEERKIVALKEEFEEIKNFIRFENVTNNLFPRLSELKSFFIKHPKFSEKPGNNDFYKKWLTSPCIGENYRVTGYWTKENIKEMLEDLDKTSL